MQPRKLTMKNFGPFINETLDFGDFQETGLFLVSGKTGAGKTTIFDGMTYALFGETSGSLRSGKEMRSMFASPKEETCVTFSFEHQGRRYEIERRPEQTLLKKRGDGTKDQAAKVTLTVFEKEQATRQFSKKNEVDQYIKELLHLDAKQFFQIIMLPQGEFRNFLIASSNDKERVLRNLFGTELYQQLNEWLKEQSKKQQQKIQQQLANAETLKTRFIWRKEAPVSLSLPETLTQWTAALQEDTQQLQELEKQLETAQKAQKEAEQKFYQAKEQQAFFEEIAELQQKQANGEKKLPRISAKKILLDRLIWSKEQQGLLEQQARNQRNYAQETARLAAVKNAQRTLEAAKKSWQECREEVQQKQEALQQKQTVLQEKKYLLPLVAERETLLAQQTALQVANSKYVAEEQQLVREQQQTTHKINDAQALLAQKEAWQEQEVRLLKAQQLAENSQKSQQAVSVFTEEILQQQTAWTVKNTEKEKLAENLEEKKQQVAILKSQNAKMQIARLSLDLLEGEPCPVCGATSHPQVAQHQVYSLQEIKDNQRKLETTEEELGTSREKLATIQQQQAQYEQAVQKLEQKLQTAKKEQQETTQNFWLFFDEPSSEKTPEDYLAAVLAVHHQQAADFKEAQQRLDAAFLAQEKVATQLQALKDNQQQLLQQEQQISGKLETLTGQTGKVTKEQLTEEIARLSIEIQTLQEFLQADTAQEEQLKAEEISLREQDKQLSNQVVQLQQEQEEIEGNVQKVLADSPFSVEEQQLREWLEDSGEIPALTKEIADFEKEAEFLEQRMRALQDKIKGSTPPDVGYFMQQRQEAETLVQNIQEHFFEQKERLTQNQKLSAELTELYKKNAQEVEAQAQLQQLFQTINGDNPYKTSLERYVLQAYLAEILTLANQRLLRLTRGRYQFELADQVNGNKKNTGLEINIYDDNAGASRRAHTLSGGESFIAALALALSLADVIQNRSGGVAIEALFIDEGFGSLDEESLEMAMEALEMIENEGRMIGIISHVRELKERVTQQLLVQTNGSGQSTIAYRS